MKELLLLQLRNAIAEKEWLTAMANRDLDLGGWRIDYIEGVNIQNNEIDRLVEAIRNA